MHHVPYSGSYPHTFTGLVSYRQDRGFSHDTILISSLLHKRNPKWNLHQERNKFSSLDSSAMLKDNHRVRNRLRHEVRSFVFGHQDGGWGPRPSHAYSWKGRQPSFLQLKSLDSALCGMQFYRIQANSVPWGIFCYFLFLLPFLVMEYDLILIGTVQNKQPRKIGSQLRHSQPLSREGNSLR